MITLTTGGLGTVAEVAEPDALNSPASSKGRRGITRIMDSLTRFEWVAVLLVGFLVASLHVRFVSHVGGLWRDEANSVNLATLPTLGEVWHFLGFDSFPILFSVVLRGWLGVFGPDNDAALRVLGCIIGLGVLGAFWLNARAFGAGLPVLSLALIGLNPMVIRYGDSMRAYGLGVLLILLTFRSFWRLVDSPSPPAHRRVLTATVLALLSVHALYYNSVLLLAITAGALAVAVRGRLWRTALIILSIGILAAVSLLAYVPMMIRIREWTFMVNYPSDFAWLWKRACEVMGSPDTLIVWLWMGLFVAGLSIVLGFGFRTIANGFARRRRPVGNSQPPLNAASAILVPSSLPSEVLFAAIALVVGVTGYAIFLRVLNYYTQPWYYITLAAFVACALDIIFGAWPLSTKFAIFPLVPRTVRLVVALLLLAFAGPMAWQEMSTRHTNLDLVAARLQRMTAKDDVILVPRWECAIPLSRYYRGPAEMVTIPPLDDHRLHRYDLVLRQMMTLNPLLPVEARLKEVLRSGHRVFIVGALPISADGVPVPALPPAYRDPSGGWHGAPYNQGWQLQTGDFLRAHVTRAGQIQVLVPGQARVQEFENLELGLMEGWR